MVLNQFFIVPSVYQCKLFPIATNKYIVSVELKFDRSCMDIVKVKLFIVNIKEKQFKILDYLFPDEEYLFVRTSPIFLKSVLIYFFINFYLSWFIIKQLLTVLSAVKK